MKKLEFFSTVAVSVAVAIVVWCLNDGQGLFSGLNQLANNQSGAGKDINVIFRYGVGAKNSLDTFKGEYVKDMISKPPMTVGFKISEDGRYAINQKINDLRLFETDANKVDSSGMIVAKIPCSSYYLKVAVNGKDRERSWDDCQGEISDNYRQFDDFLINLIESKPEYKSLPAAVGVYM